MRLLPSNNSRRRARADLSHPDPKADGFTDQFQYRTESKGPDYPIQFRDPATFHRRAPMGIGSVLGEGSKIPYKTINTRVETIDTAPSYRQAFKKRRCLIPARRILRMEEGRRRQNPPRLLRITLRDGRCRIEPFSVPVLINDAKELRSPCAVLRNRQFGDSNSQRGGFLLISD